MKRLSTLACALLCVMAVSACSDDNDNPGGPSPNANPNELRFIADLHPANEVPPITNADQTGRGNLTFVMTVTRDGGSQITSAVGRFEVSLNGFPAGTTLTGAHIHPGPAGQNGTVAVNTTLASGEVVLGNGSGSFTKTQPSIDAALAQAIANNPTAYYFNVHTTLNTTGAARGQLNRTQ